MFEYFPDNYAWSLAVMMADACGGTLGEIDDTCRPLREWSTRPGLESSRAWADSWRRTAARVQATAEADAAKGRMFSAGRKRQRACAYWMLAERQMPNSDPARAQVYQQMLSQFEAWQATREQPVQRCKVPYEGGTLPALFVGAGSSPGPCMVMFDGFDIMKETICLMQIDDDFRRRGISLLIVDHPGVGEALRLQGLRGMPETERPARASLEYLLTRADVDPARIGILAPSAGGYHAVRSAALEPRFACCVAWTGVWNWGALFKRRLEGSLAQSVHFHLEHAEWVYGAQGVDDVVRKMAPMNLEGIAEKLRCPLLITHGERDRQTPVAEAHRVYDAATNCARRELRVFTPEEGGCEHCHVDNQTLGTDYIADWVAEILGGHRGPRH